MKNKGWSSSSASRMLITHREMGDTKNDFLPRTRNSEINTEVCIVKDLNICSPEVLMFSDQLLKCNDEVPLYIFNSLSVTQFICKKMF